MDKEFAGQPLWIWLVGAVVVVGGYLYLTHGSKSGAQQPAAGGGTPEKSTSTFSETIKDLQSNPKPTKKPPKKDPGK